MESRSRKKLSRKELLLFKHRVIRKLFLGIKELENIEVEGISMRETFASFLLDLDNSNLTDCSDLLEKEVLRIMCKEGFSQKQIYEMPLKKLLDIFYDAYLWNADRILSKAPVINVHLKQRHLG